MRQGSVLVSLAALHFVGEKFLLIAEVQDAVCDNRVRPRGLATSIRLFETAEFLVSVRSSRNERYRTAFTTDYEHSIHGDDRTLAHATVAPRDFSCLEIDT